MTATGQCLTLAEFLELPEEKPALEYADGQVTQKMSPKGQHSTLQFTLPQRINRFAQPQKLAYAFPELRVTFAGVSRVPDVSVYRWERIPRTSDGLVANDFMLPPDIAIEIVSPRQGVNALIRRCIWFVEHGVQIALLADPDDASVISFRPGAPLLALHGADRINLDEVLPGFELTVEDLFASLSLK